MAAASATSDHQASPRRSPLYAAVIGLASLGVVLQGLWAGFFIREGHDNRHQWVEVHARGAEVTIALAAIATLIALWQLRSRPGIIIGSAVFTVLLIVESYLGGRVGGSPALEEIHFPLAMALVGLAVWLPLRAGRGR